MKEWSESEDEVRDRNEENERRKGVNEWNEGMEKAETRVEWGKRGIALKGKHKYIS